MNFAALIITYNPSISLLWNNVRSIYWQVEKVVIVDNGSTNKNEIEELSAVSNLQIIYLDINKGIAKALNHGVTLLSDEGYIWVLTLDQDSVCPDNIIVSFKRFISNSDCGIVCPAIDYLGDGSVKPKDDFEYVYACMTSASLTNISAWKEVGGFDENYFIDFVDNDFCKKLELHGYKIYKDLRVVLRHQLGETKHIACCGFEVNFGEHSPLRSYYMVRNNLYFIKKYHDSLNSFKEITKLLYIITNIILFSKQRSKHIKYILRGLNDGFCRKMGKLNCIK